MNIIDQFETYEGMIYRLVEVYNERLKQKVFVIKRNFLVVHTCDSLTIAQGKFVAIRNIFLRDNQIRREGVN